MAHGILLVDKASGLSSHAVVARARRALGTRAVGHAGTLDPMATGLLVLGVGEGLKALRYLTLDDKRYEARVTLGVQTDTLDAEGVPEAHAPVPADLCRARVAEACLAFVGSIRQRPPRISALKQAGVPLYARARRGEVVEPPEREVRVHSIEVEAVATASIELRVHSGKGFYVRSLARDLGLALGTRAHLSALRRTASGAFDLRHAITMDALLAGGPALAARLLTIPQALPEAPCLRLDPAGAAHALCGRPVPRGHVLGGELGAATCEPRDLPDGTEPVLLCDEAGRPLAFARAEPESFRVVRGLRLPA